MHIEPGVVIGAKMVLSYSTAAIGVGMLLQSSIAAMKKQGVSSFLLRSSLAVFLVLVFFELLPHFPVGVSEVHFILGATLFLILGLAPTAVGLAAGLLFQGLLFSPSDIPQFGMNVTTLLIPLFGLRMLADKVIPGDVSYVQTRYSQALKLSLIYQGGIVSWVAFWAFYGQGAGAENLANIASFGVAYLSVIAIEPILSVAVLASAKMLDKEGFLSRSQILNQRLFYSA